MPDDQGAQYGYAQCLLQLGNSDEADRVFVKAIELSPLSEITELARTARTSIAQQSLRTAVEGGVRLDAVMYLSGRAEEVPGSGRRQDPLHRV